MCFVLIDVVIILTILVILFQVLGLLSFKWNMILFIWKSLHLFILWLRFYLMDLIVYRIL